MIKINKNMKISLIIAIPIIIIIIIISFFCLGKTIINKSNNSIKASFTNNDVDVEKTNLDYNNLNNVSIKKGEKVNKSSKVKKEHTVISDLDDTLTNLTVTNMEIYSNKEKDMSHLKAIITNKGTEVVERERIQITFLDNNRRKITSLDYVITQNINPLESITIELDEIIDFTNAYDYEVKILS